MNKKILSDSGCFLFPRFFLFDESPARAPDAAENLQENTVPILIDAAGKVKMQEFGMEFKGNKLILSGRDSGVVFDNSTLRLEITSDGSDLVIRETNTSGSFEYRGNTVQKVMDNMLLVGIQHYLENNLGNQDPQVRSDMELQFRGILLRNPEWATSQRMALLH